MRRSPVGRQSSAIPAGRRESPRMTRLRALASALEQAPATREQSALLRDVRTRLLSLQGVTAESAIWGLRSHDGEDAPTWITTA